MTLFKAARHFSTIDGILSRPQLVKNKAFIGGEWIGSASRKTYPVCNPANGNIITQVSDCAALDLLIKVKIIILDCFNNHLQVSDVGIEETEMAISSAHSVQESWAALPAKV